MNSKRRYSKKVYKVHIGTWLEKDELGQEQEDTNWSDKTLVAINADDAIKKVRLHKNEFIVGVEMLETLDQ